MKYVIPKGATSVIMDIFVQDSSSTTGAGLTGLVFNTGSLTAYYHRNTASSATAISLVTMTVGTFTSSGFKEIDSTNMPGAYQLCVPDAAFITGADNVSVLLKGAANMSPVVLEVQLRPAAADVYTWNGTAVATPDTAGYPKVTHKSGTGTGELNLSSGVVDGNVTKWSGTVVAAVDTAGYPKVTVKSGTGTGEISLSSGVASADAVKISGDSTAADNLESAYDGTGYSDGTTQTGCNTTTVVLASGSSSTTDYYKKKRVAMLSGPAAGLDGIITAYNGTTKAATVSPAFAVSPTAGGGDTYVLESSNANVVTSESTLTVTVGTNNDKTGYGLSGTQTYNNTGTWTGSLTGSVGSVTGAVGSVSGNVGGNVAGSVASVTGNVGGNVTGSVGSVLAKTSDGTAQAGSSTTLTLVNTSSSTDDFYKGYLIQPLSGTGGGQAPRLCTGYVGSTKVATVTPAWTVTPDSTTTYQLVSAADWFRSVIIESAGSYTVQQALSVLLAAIGGVSASGGTQYKTPDGVTTRITSTVDGSNNRTAVTLVPSS